MKTFILLLLTNDRLVIRFISSWVVGAVLLFAAWFISDAWLPDKFFRFLPGMVISPVECTVGSLSESMKTFGWNLAITGGLCIFASLFAVGRFPMGYAVPWILFGIYGGLLGTDSFNCINPLNLSRIDPSILWTRAGFREISGYLLITAALANMHQWRQQSFWSLKVERVRRWSEFTLSGEIILSLLAAVGLIAWGAIEEVFNFL